MSGRLKRVLAGAAVLGVLSVLVLPATALCKSFTVDDVTIGAHVARDGTLAVSEKRTLTFDGDFSRVFWVLDKGGATAIEIDSITDDRNQTYTRTDDPGSVEARPEGTFYVEDGAEAVTVHVFHRSSSEERSFTLNYRAMGAAKRWADTGELYWQLLGDQSDVATKRFAASIGVEGVTEKAKMRAWAHGPLNGEVTIAERGDVGLTVDEVPPNTFVEVRLAFPAEVLSDARLIDEPRLDQILKEEKANADEANAQRVTARLLMAFWIGLPSLAALVALVFGVRAFLVHGREHRAQFQGQYFREDPRPELHPAVIDSLMNFGPVKDGAIAATLMNLADNGVITMAPQIIPSKGIGGLFGKEEQSFTLTRNAGTEEKQTSLDRDLLSLLFGTVGGGRDTISLTEIEPYAKEHAQTFSQSVKDWKDSAEAEANALGMFEGGSWSWQVGVFAAAVVIGVIAVFGASQIGSGWPLCVPIPTVIVLGVLGLYMRRRSREGNELYRTYSAVREYLKDFSRLEEAPPSSVMLWNRFLVLAVIFGVAEQVIEQLRVKLPQIVQDPAFQTSYWWAYSGTYGHSPVSAVSTSFVSATTAATSKMSSASGGGGGFSGGGGGGGGGGGFGAD